jgi:hypothetical protein
MSTNAIRRPITALAVALAMFAATIAYAPPARAAVACGDVVTTDVVLEANLVCPGTPGLIVGASGIAIDLNGYTVRNALFGSTASGIEITGHSDVKVFNGTVRDFFHNVVFENVHNGHVIDLVLRGGGGTGLLFRNASDSSATGIDARDFPDAAVEVTQSTRVSLSGITARRAGWGIFIVHSIGTVVSDSDLRRNFFGALVVAGNGNTIQDTVAINNSDAGLANEGGTKTTFERVDVRRNPIGVRFIEGGDGSALLDSTVRRNGVGVQLGWVSRLGGFPMSFDATNVRVLRNTIRNNDASGISLDQAGTGTIEHRIEDNRIIGNGLNPGSYVNTSNDVLDDGINVLAPAGEVDLGRNRANSNGDYGIYAPGQNDLGGNTASGNRNPAQCSGVSC